MNKREEINLAVCDHLHWNVQIQEIEGNIFEV